MDTSGEGATSTGLSATSLRTSSEDTCAKTIRSGKEDYSAVKPPENPTPLGVGNLIAFGSRKFI